VCSPIDGQDRGHVLWVMGSVTTHGAKAFMSEAAVLFFAGGTRGRGRRPQHPSRHHFASLPVQVTVTGALLSCDEQMAAGDANIVFIPG
jgi:hypothetical protein